MLEVFDPYVKHALLGYMVQTNNISSGLLFTV